MSSLCVMRAHLNCGTNTHKTDSLPYQKRPNYWQLRAQDCGWAPDLPACSPCGATAPQCAWVRWGRPLSEHAPAPGTPSCGRPGSRADPGPQPVSSWTRWRLSHSGPDTATPWHNHSGATTVTDGRRTDETDIRTKRKAILSESWVKLTVNPHHIQGVLCTTKPSLFK